MAYLVLARKYRPVSFAELVGQAHVVRTLCNAMTLQRVHHAFLFCGARGVGKTTAARLLARALNCAAGVSPTPCGQCAPCVEILAGRCADVLEIDGASHTGVDNVRSLRDSARYMPSLCRTKIYIIDEIHMLSSAAFNALLKILEEPPAHLKFIFATTEPQKIPLTILSRCQRFDFRRLRQPQLVQHLQDILTREGLQVSSAVLTSLASESQGSVRDALSLLDQLLSYRGSATTPVSDAALLEALGIINRQSIFQLWDAILKRQATPLLEHVDALDSRGLALAQVASLLAEHGRDLAVLKALQPSPQSAAAEHVLLERSAGELAQLQQQATQRSAIELQQLFRQLLALSDDVARASMPKITLEMGLLRLLLMAPSSDLETLLQRLEGLANGNASPSEPASTAPPLSSPVSNRGLPSAALPLPSGAALAPAAVAANAPAASTSISTPESPTANLSNADSPAFVQFVGHMRGVRPAVASLLEHGQMVHFAPAGVVLAYTPGTFYWDAIRHSEVVTLLNNELQQLFGQPVALQIVDGATHQQAAASLAQVQAQAAQTHTAQVQQAALAHPAVQDTISILEAGVQHIHVNEHA